MNKLLYIRQLLLSLNHVWEDNIATFSYFFITITEAARYRIIDTTGYTPFTPRSFEPADTMITVCKILNTVVCGSSNDSQCSVFYVWSWFDLHFSEGKKRDFYDILKHIDYNPGENHWKSLTHAKRNLCIKDCELSHDGTSNKGDNA